MNSAGGAAARAAIAEQIARFIGAVEDGDAGTMDSSAG